MSKTSIPNTKYINEYKQIMMELRAQNFDVIRFATYRTACKLRFIQKKLNLHLIDLWNVIETFRENNLHTLDILYEIDLTRLELILTNMYKQLNKRLSIAQHINIETMSLLLTSWLLNLFDLQKINKIKLFSLKIALTTLCSGRLIDKIKYIFTQISDPKTNFLIISKFEYYLKDLLQIPTSLYEEPSFGYLATQTSKTCFDLTSNINLEEFLDISLSETGPACFIWLNIFHRMVLVQNTIHPVTCMVCQRHNFIGFRYKCQKCRNYQLCQDCFWRGRTSGSHQLMHQMKEYTVYKSTAKQLSNSLKRSFFCKPKESKNTNIQSITSSNTQFGSPPTTTKTTTNNDNSLLTRVKQQQPHMQSQNSTLASFTPQTHLASTTAISNNNTLIDNRTGGGGCSKNLSPCCSTSKKETDNTIYKKPIDLTHIVPSPTPIPPIPNTQQQQQNNFSNTISLTRKSLDDSNTSLFDPTLKLSFEQMNDEHRLISRYTSRLTNYYQNRQNEDDDDDGDDDNEEQQLLLNSNKNQNIRSLSESNFRFGLQSPSNGLTPTNNAITTSFLNSESILNEKKKLIIKLENKNREILKEIKRLRLQQESNRSLDEQYLNLTASLSRESTPLTINSNHTSKSILNYQQPNNLIAELKTLKQRKGELDSRIQTLEQNRDELLTQLSTVDTLMKNMKVNSLSTRSTPIRVASQFDQNKYSTFSNVQNIYGGRHQQHHSMLGNSPSPYNDSLIQLLQTTYKTVNPTKSSSLPTTPAMSDYYYNYMKQQQYYSSGHETINSSNCSSSNVNVRNLRNDLMLAADSVTNAMHCLVKELNSENESIRSIINSNDDLDFDFKTKIKEKEQKEKEEQQKQQQKDSMIINIEKESKNEANYRIFLDDNESDNNKIEDDAQIINKNQNEMINNEKQSEDDQKSFISSTNEDYNENEQQMKQIIENNKQQQQQQQQILDLDEDAFFFTDNLLSNNLQVALWRRELEQRLNPTDNSPQLSPSKQPQEINEEIIEDNNQIDDKKGTNSFNNN